MAQDPLHVLWVEPQFPGPAGCGGRLAGAAARLSRVRSTATRSSLAIVWPTSVGQGARRPGLRRRRHRARAGRDLVARLERSLCYSYGCWEVLEKERPRPIDLIVGRSAGLGSSLFAPAYQPAAPVVNFLDYYYHAHRHDLAGEAGPETPAAYFHWRRSMAAIDLLDLERCHPRLDADALAARAFPRRVPRPVPGLARRHQYPPVRRLARACQGRRPAVDRGTKYP